MRESQVAVICVLWFGCAPPAFQGSAAPWPPVQPASARFHVDLGAERAIIDLPLKGRDGAVLYHFACRGVRETYLDTLPGNWVGPLMCTLAEGTEATEGGLLSEDASPARYSRGQYRANQLVGDCARYPEFGVHRSFRLRGFRLTLDAEDVRTDGAGVAQSFVLAVSVVADASAVTANAARPGFLDPQRPGGSCRTAVRGAEPLMCRDDRGSWRECPK
jgi:hypothetical protein